jgi:hypothetical protein
MWYFVSGKLMSVITGMVLFKSLNNLTGLFILERSIGWFLIEHVFEESNLTAGKLFLVNEDFRTLIKNFIVLLRNIIFLAQALTPLEFFIINFILIFIFIFYKNKSLKTIVRIIIVVSYFLLFQSFLFFNIFLLNIFLTYLIFYFLIIIASIFYTYLFYLYMILLTNEKKCLIKYFILKFFILITVFIIHFTYFLYRMDNIIGENENPILILSIIFLVPYMYIYYTYFFKNNLS